MTENCSVAIGFHGVVSQQNNFCHDRVLAKGRRFLIATVYFYVTTELARPGVFYHDRMFLCRDRVWLNGEVLCCDRAIRCRD